MTFDWLSLAVCFFTGLCCGSFLPPIISWVSKQIARRRVLVMDYSDPCGSDCLIQRRPVAPTDAEIQKLLHDLHEAVTDGKHSNPRLAASSK